jgi:endonuclease-3
MTLAAVRSFIEAIAAANPEPETELEYSTSFTLLVAVVLSAQATDVSVNKATVKLFADAPDPAAMVRLGVDGVAKQIRTIGL